MAKTHKSPIEQAINKVRRALDSYREETETWMESSNNDVWNWIEN